MNAYTLKGTSSDIAYGSVVRISKNGTDVSLLSTMRPPLSPNKVPGLVEFDAT
jgi:hypothetical protein